MTRVADAWRTLGREQRRAALAALGLFLSMFLPWYSETVVSRTAPKPTQTSLTAFQDFSFVEAAVLLVSAGVLAMLFARAERRSFELPGGDGLIVMIAGGWSAVLIFYRLLDKPGVHGNQIIATVGVQWGIFIALLVALGLLFAGAAMRAAAHLPDPSIGVRAPRSERPAQRSDGGDAPDPPPAPAQRATTVAPAGRPQTPASAALSDRPAPRPRFPPAPDEQQMSFEEPPPERG
jgi:hypothetical protein